MIVSILVVLATSAAFVAACRPTVLRLDPRRASWLIAAGSLATATATAGALALLAWPLAARVPVVAHAGDWRPQLVGAGIPVPVTASLAALLLLLALGLVLTRRVIVAARRYRDLWEAQTELSRGGRGPITVVEDRAPLAYAVPAIGWHQGRTVVSTGLLDALDEGERAAVLAHEAAHLRHHHDLFRLVHELASTINPLLRLMSGDLGYQLERWADEEAAARAGRRATARAIAKSALGRIEHTRMHPAMSWSLHVGAYAVSGRVGALLDDEPIDARLAVVPLVLAVVGCAALAWACHDMEGVFEVLRRLH